MTYCVVWEFRPAPGRAAEFEEAYGGAGRWARLFRRGEGYLGTELVVPTDSDGWYRTTDRWTSAAAYAAFRSAFAKEYQALDAACEALTAEERHVRSGLTGA
ncbi:MAG TPA: antibiotic biosynthesis monooxygenase [Gemmatimonadales bacterium]|nr:antibiotic biosynthesis monooxygenase [Gemmatimonadales bacterium]